MELHGNNVFNLESYKMDITEGIKEDLIITGDKVRKVITEEIEYDVSELLAHKEAELIEWTEQVRLYNEAADEITRNLKRDIRKLKNGK